MADSPQQDIRMAEARARAARADLFATIGIIQERLTARSLMRQAADAGQNAARKGADAVQRNPGALAGAVAVAGLLLAHHRIAALLRRSVLVKPRRRPRVNRTSVPRRRPGDQA